MGRPRRPGHRLPPRLAHQPRQVGRLVDPRGEFRYGGEQGEVGDFLIGVAMLHGGLLVAGHRDHRNTAEIGVLQARGEIGGAHRLGKADTRPAGDPGIAVGHVSDGFLAVTQDAGDAERAEFNQGTAQDGVDEEDVRRAVGGEAASQVLCPRYGLRAVHGCFPYWPGGL